MSARLYREAFTQTIESSFEPGKQNKFQTWCKSFSEDTTPFYRFINGRKVEVSRLRIAAMALKMGQEYMEAMNTRQIPKGFFVTEVLPAVDRVLGAN